MERRSVIIRCVDVFLRLAIGGLFVYAGAAKAANPERFVNDVAAYHVLPYVATVATALYLPWLEILCGWSLLIRRMDRGAAALLITLLIVFIAMTATAWIRGIDVSCGCFGFTWDISQAWQIIRNILILLGLSIILRIREKFPNEKF